MKSINLKFGKIIILLTCLIVFYSCSNNNTINTELQPKLDKLAGTWYSTDGNNYNITFSNTIVSCLYSSKNECASYASTNPENDEIADSGEFWISDDSIIFQHEKNASKTIKYNINNDSLTLNGTSYSRTQIFNNPDVTESKNTNNNTLNNSKKTNITYDSSGSVSLIGEWISVDLSGTAKYIFYEDGTFYRTWPLMNQDYGGTYTYDDEKITLYLDSGVTQVRRYTIDTNLMRLDNDSTYIQGTDFPGLKNSYTKALEGYYIDTYGNYYYFDGELNVDIGSNGYLYGNSTLMYHATENELWIFSSLRNYLEEFFFGDYYFDGDNIVIYKGCFNYGYTEYTGCGDNSILNTLTPIDKTEFDKNAVINNLGNRYFFQVLADSIKIREEPSLKSSRVDRVTKGEIVTYYKDDTTIAEGYTWYRTYDGWIADNGEWIRILN